MFCYRDKAYARINPSRRKIMKKEIHKRKMRFRINQIIKPALMGSVHLLENKTPNNEFQILLYKLKEGLESDNGN